MKVPGESFAAQQRDGYPDLEPLTMALPPDKAFDKARTALASAEPAMVLRPTDVADVQRTYDSFDKSVGDFGHGMRMTNGSGLGLDPLELRQRVAMEDQRPGFDQDLLTHQQLDHATDDRRGQAGARRQFGSELDAVDRDHLVEPGRVVSARLGVLQRRPGQPHVRAHVRIGLGPARMIEPAQEAELMLMDEPLSGLDTPSQEGLLDLLDTLRDQNVTVMVATP